MSPPKFTKFLMNKNYCDKETNIYSLRTMGEVYSGLIDNIYFFIMKFYTKNYRVKRRKFNITVR